MQGKQAKIVSPTQERAILGYLDTTRYPSRDRVMFLLSMKAGQQFPLSVSASTVFWPFGPPLCFTAGLPAITLSKIARS